jgi:hypothetical protein
MFSLNFTHSFLHSLPVFFAQSKQAWHTSCMEEDGQTHIPSSYHNLVPEFFDQVGS